MTRLDIINKLIVGLLIVLFFSVSLYIRIALPYNGVFTGEWIKFSGTDTYFYMRIVDNLLHNFPNVIRFDPLALFPGGYQILIPPFFPILVASTILMLSFGSPTPTMVDTISVFIPAVLGALTVIPVFFICKALFNRWVGILAAGLIAIMPGEFLGRSILGFTDQHIAETLFSAASILFLILAIKSKKRLNDISVNTASLNKSKDFYRTVIFILLAGLFLGIYLITWYGALLLVLIIFVFFIIQSIINHIKRDSLINLCIINTIVFLIAFLIFIPTSRNLLVLGPLVIAILVPVILTVISLAFNKYRVNTVIYPIAVILLGAICSIFLYLINPSTFAYLITSLNIFTWPIGTTILEMQPLLFPNNQFSFAAVWGNFATAFVMAIIALGILIYQATKKIEAEKVLVVVWSLIILAATLSMRRFAYYFAVNVAILAGFLSWLIIDFLSFWRQRRIQHQITVPKGRYKKKDVAIIEKKIKANPLMLGLAIVLVFVLGFLPIIAIVPSSTGVYFAPSNAWCESLTWLKNNSPDPFNDPYYYNVLYKTPALGETYQYPYSAYSVTSWWDYGYWITRIGHRIPISNPGTNHNGEAFYFIAHDEDSANEIMNKWNSKYVILSYDIATVYLKFWALAELGGTKVSDYVDIYYREQNGRMEPQVLYSPAYFQTMIIRLYDFNGEGVIPKEPLAITYREQILADGILHKVITSSKTLSSYEQAQIYLSSLKTTDHAVVVSSNPFSSPVPLEELKHYKLVHNSSDNVTGDSSTSVPEIKIFEYIP